MKNIQEILLKCGGIGKLKLGDEEMDVSVISTNSGIRRLDGYTDCFGNKHEGKEIIGTHLEVCVWGDEFCEL